MSPDGYHYRGIYFGGRDVSMDLIIKELSYWGNLGASHPLDRPLIDQTGLQGHFDFAFRYMNSYYLTHDPLNGVPLSAEESSDPAFVAALKKELGLEIKSTKGNIGTFVIDHVERPSEN